jgi:tRNA(Ile)-lysidine synthase
MREKWLWIDRKFPDISELGFRIKMSSRGLPDFTTPGGNPILKLHPKSEIPYPKSYRHSSIIRIFMPPHVLVDCLKRELSRLAEPRLMLVAVSGGADSMALLRGLLQLRSELALTLHVGHLDHQLRGPASQEDADWLYGVCQQLDVPLTIGRANVGQAALRAGTGIEETARDARYDFLQETARITRSRVIALGHTANDQAETILHHVLRGTGLAGLRGIPRERQLDSGIRLLRPLLDVERSTVRNFLGQIEQDFREDASNQDENFTRNHIRRSLLPLLAEEYNPQIRKALLRLGRQADEAQAAFDALAGSLLERTLDSSSSGECRLKCQPFQDVPRHLIRETMSLLWKRLGWPRQKMGFDQWDELARIVIEGGATTLPAEIDARREGRWLVLSRRSGLPH